MIRLKTAVQVGLAAMSLVVASLGIGWGTAHAQIGGGQGGGFGGGQSGGLGGGQGGPAMPMRGPQMMFGGGGGPAAIAEDQNFLYVVRGSEIVKVQKGDLKIVASATLPPPAGGPRMGGGGFGGGGQ